MNKNIKFIGWFLYFIFITQTIYSQKYGQPHNNQKYHAPSVVKDIDIKRDDMLKNADYIFEGRVLNKKYAVEGYYNAYKSMIYSSVQIEITKILRGMDELKLGTIILLREGGTIVDYRDGEIHFLDKKYPTLDKLSSLSRNCQLFICNKSNFPDNPRNIQVDNPQRVEFFYDKSSWEMNYETRDDGTLIGLKGMRFDSIPMLYKYLRKYKNINTRNTKNRRALKEAKKKEKIKKRQFAY